MRLIVPLLITVIMATAQTVPLPNVFGVWVADPPKANPEPAGVPEHLFLKIVQEDDGRIKLIEIHLGKNGASVTREKCTFVKSEGEAVKSSEPEKGTGRAVHIRCGEQLEEWSLAEDGLKLAVRTPADGPAAAPRTRVFRRAERVSANSRPLR